MKKLTRSRSDKVIFGVCGGLAEYFNIDATLIRIVWFILGLVSFGTAGVAYLVAGFIIPEDDGYIYQDGDNPAPNQNNTLIIGIGLILLGAYLLIKIIYPRLLSFSRYWPVLLIILGLYIIFNHNKDK